MTIREPCIFTFKYPFTKEVNDMLLIILTKECNGKYKKTAKGKINIYKKQILSDQLYYEKYIHLELYKSQTDLNIKEYTGTDIIATISNIGKVYMKAQLFDSKLNISVENVKQTSIKEDVNSIFVSSNEVISLTKVLKKAIKKFKEDNPEMIKHMNSAKDSNPNRFKSIIEKTNILLTGNKKQKSQKTFDKNAEESEDEELDKLNLEDFEENKHFNDGLSELSDELEKEKEDFHKKLVNEDQLFSNIENIHSEMNEMVAKFMSLYQEKANV